MTAATWSGTLAAIAALGLASSAAAQEAPVYGWRAPWMPEAQQNRVGVELDWFHHGDRSFSTDVLTWDLVAQLGVTRNVFLDLDVPWAYLSTSAPLSAETPTNGKFIFGTPLLGFHYAGVIGRQTSYFAGLGFGIPFDLKAGDPNHAAAAFARGYPGAERFLEAQVPIYTTLGIEYSSGIATLRADATPTFLIPFNNGRGAALIEQGNELRLHAGFGLSGGVRITEALLILRSAATATASAEPFVGYERPGRTGLFVRAGVVLLFGGDQDQLAFGRQTRLTSRLLVGAKF
jgi:hypothetical protein